MSVHLAPIGNGFQFFTRGGVPLGGGLIYTYAAGTSTPTATYTDMSGTVPHSNPIVLMSDGRVASEIWLTDGQAYKFVLQDSYGNLIATYDNLTGINGVSPYMLSINDFGAVGDGVTDNRDAIAQAYAVASQRGWSLTGSPGQYLIDTDGGSITTEDVAFIGPYVQDGSNVTIDKGLCFFITGTTNAAFAVRRGTQFRGVGFYYPNQVNSATPVAYPPTLDLDFTGGAVPFVYVDSCVVYNAYRFCRMNDAAGAVGHCWFTNNNIYGIHRCFEVTHNAETLHFQGNDFTPGVWIAATEPGVIGYTRANGAVFQFDRSDGAWIIGNLLFGYLYGILSGAGNAVVQLMTISGNVFDQVRYSLDAGGSGNITFLTITGNTFYSFNSQNTSLQAQSIRITTDGAANEEITITGNTFALSTEDHIFASGNNAVRDYVFTGNTFANWAAFKAAGNYGGINFSGAVANYCASGNFFTGVNFSYASGVLGTPNTCTLLSNEFNLCKQAVNITTNVYTAIGNVSFQTFDATSDTVAATVVTSINSWDKPGYGTPSVLPIATVQNFANDAAAAGGGIPIGGDYRNGSIRMIRVA